MSTSPRCAQRARAPAGDDVIISPAYRICAGAFLPSRRPVAAGQQPVSFDWSWDSHLLWTLH